MLFTSYPFLALLLLLYYAIPRCFQWRMLLGASWLFYFCARPDYPVYILVTTGTVYLAARAIDGNMACQKRYLNSALMSQ